MSTATEAALIRSRFQAQWTQTPFAFENVRFNPQATVPYVRLQIESGIDAFQADLAPDPRYRSTGMVVVQVFVPAGTGDGQARELAQGASDIFRGWMEQGLVFRAPQVRPVGTADGWYQVDVMVPYHYDVIY